MAENDAERNLTCGSTFPSDIKLSQLTNEIKKLIIELLNTWHNLIEETFKSGIGMNWNLVGPGTHGYP